MCHFVAVATNQWNPPVDLSGTFEALQQEKIKDLSGHAELLLNGVISAEDRLKAIRFHVADGRLRYNPDAQAGISSSVLCSIHRTICRLKISKNVFLQCLVPHVFFRMDAAGRAFRVPSIACCVHGP